MEYGCEFQILSNELNGKLFMKRTPLSGGIEVTNKCNFRCVHCYETIERESNVEKKIPLDKMLQIIDEIERMGCISVFLTGGEAMLDENFDTIYVYLRKKGIMVSILSNGTTISEEKCKLFRQYVPKMIDISLYGGSEKIYKRVTQVDNGYKRVIAGLDLLKKYEIPFQLKGIILKDNVRELEEMRKLASYYNVSLKLFTGIRPYNDGTKLPLEHMLSNEEIIALESKDSQICEYYQEKKQSYNTREFSQRQKNYNTYLCRIAQNSFFVTYDGKLNGCVRSRRNGYDLLAGTYEDGWKYLYDKFVVPVEKQSFMCSKCKVMDYCDFCPGEFEIETGSPIKAPDNLCKLAHMRRKKFG